MRPILLSLLSVTSFGLAGCHSSPSTLPPLPPGYEGKSFAELQKAYDKLHFQYIVDCGASTQENVHPALCGQEEETMTPLGNYLIAVELGGAKK
jgi:hypothetical protein